MPSSRKPGRRWWPWIRRQKCEQALDDLAEQERRARIALVHSHQQEIERITEPLGLALGALVNINPDRDEFGYRIVVNLSAEMMQRVSRLGEDREFEWIADHLGQQVARKLRQLGISGVVRAAEESRMERRYGH